jgi:hypothetical protein
VASVATWPKKKRERETQREREREREEERNIQRERERKKETYGERVKERNIQRGRERERKKETYREGEREKKKETYMGRENERERERERAWEVFVTPDFQEGPLALAFYFRLEGETGFREVLYTWTENFRYRYSNQHASDRRSYITESLAKRRFRSILTTPLHRYLNSVGALSNRV